MTFPICMNRFRPESTAAESSTILWVDIIWEFACDFGQALSDPIIGKRIEQEAHEFGVQGLKNLQFVIMEPTCKMASCTCVVKNAFLQQTLMSVVDSEDAFVYVAVKAIVHLYRQLMTYRSTNPKNLAEAPSALPPDPDMCAYCGKASSTRMYCSLNRMIWYCSPECQTKHWKMKGSFHHQRECKLLADTLVTPPAIPVGRLVMIHGLTTAAGQCINGQDAIVVMQPLTNGRLGVVLVNDVSKEEVKRLKNGDVSWIPSTLQKAIKIGKLELVWIVIPEKYTD